MRRGILISFAIFIIGCQDARDYYALPAWAADNRLYAVIEIPAGHNKKYEYNPESKTFELEQINGKDRVIDFVGYPGNYGFIPSTEATESDGGDGDALDILVISESKAQGTVMEVIPLAVLKLLDDGEEDHKIIAVPASPDAQVIKARSLPELQENYQELMSLIELWFINYNKSDPVVVVGWGDMPDVKSIIEKASKND